MSYSSADAESNFLDIDLAIEQVGDLQAVQGMLSMLEESLARDVPRIAQLLADGDVKAANRVLHGLKGFIPIFCVDALCQHVARVEEMSKTAGAAEVGIAYAPLMGDLEQLQGEVVDYMNNQGGA